MSENFNETATKSGLGSGGGGVRELSRGLPRLFGERPEETEGTSAEVAAGVVGGSEGGAVREEVCDLLAPSEEPEPGAGRRGWTETPDAAVAGDVGREPGSGYGDAGGDGAARAREEEVERAQEEGAARAPGEEMVDDEPDEHAYDEDYVTPALAARRKGSPARKLRAIEVKLGPAPAKITAGQRLLILDTWQRTGLPAGDFAACWGCPNTRSMPGRSGSRSMGRRGWTDSRGGR